MLYTVGRAAEWGEGHKRALEVAGQRVLVTRHRGEWFALDANCFHMGQSLAEGDLEDVASVHPCIVCPAHRYRIDMRTGQKVDTDLCGKACGSKDQKQRTYQVYTDGDKVQVYIPDAPQPEVPSDKYNYWSVGAAALSTPPRRAPGNSGLFGSVAAPATPGENDPFAISLSQEPPSEAASPAAGAQQQQQPGVVQGHINFRAMRARQAMLQKAYKPPTAPRPQPRGLFGEAQPSTSGSGAAGSSSGSAATAAAAAAAQPAPALAPLQPQVAAPRQLAPKKEPPPGQRTLTSLWGLQAPQAAATTGPADMDTD